MTSALVLVNMGLTLLYPIAKMIGRTKRSKCSTCCEVEVVPEVVPEVDSTRRSGLPASR